MEDFGEFFQMALDEGTDIQYRLDFIFETLDEWLLEGYYERVDQILIAAQEEYLEDCIGELAIAIGLLTVTKHADDELSNREKLLRSFKKESPEHANLFKGLEEENNGD